MYRHSFFAAVIFFLFSTSFGQDSAQTPPAKPPSIAVMDFDGRNVTKPDAAALADRFRFELVKTEKFMVMEREQMYMILQEQEFQKSDCVDQSCAVQAGQLIAVKKIVTGTVAKVGGIYTVNVKLLDVATGKVDMNLSEDCDCPIEKVLTESLRRVAWKLAGLEVKEAASAVVIQRGDASLFVKTEPEEASIYLDGKLMDGRTPVTLENLIAGRHALMVKKADMIAKKDVDLVSNQVARITLAMEKQKTILKIMSIPSEAEVYLSKKPGIGVKPDQIAPAIFENLTVDTPAITLFKVGYRDTTIMCPTIANEINSYSIQMKDADIDVIKAQKKMVQARSRRKIGVTLSVTSLAVGAAGGVLYYLAKNDYKDARSARDFLETSDIQAGSAFDQKKKENEDKTKSGDLKATVSGALFGVGGAGLAAGVVLYF
jgi:hypothetical protein